MPTKDASILGTGVLYCDGTPIGRISDGIITNADVKTDADSEYEETKKYIRNDDSFEASFNVSSVSIDMLRIILLGNNNWRKRNKLPMISRKRYRHESKKRRR